MTDSVIQKEVTTTSTNEPQTVQTTRVIQPAVGENPQKTFQRKKTIFQFNNIVWYIAGLIEVLLLARFILEVITTTTAGFTGFIYNLTEIFVLPFKGIVAPSVSGNSTLDWAVLIAMAVIAVIALLIVYLIDLVRPVSPEQIRDSEVG